MKKTFLFTDIKRPGKLKLERRSHPPRSDQEGFVWARVPRALENEEADWLEIIDVEITEQRPVQAVDGNGNPVFETEERPIVDEDGIPTGEFETVQVPVWQRDQDGNIIYETVNTGQFEKRVQLNQALKDQILSQRAADEQSRTQAEQARLDALRAIRQTLRDIRDTDSTNVSQCNTKIKQLARACLENIRLLIADSQ